MLNSFLSTIYGSSPSGYRKETLSTSEKKNDNKQDINLNTSSYLKFKKYPHDFPNQALPSQQTKEDQKTSNKLDKDMDPKKHPQTSGAKKPPCSDHINKQIQGVHGSTKPRLSSRAPLSRPPSSGQTLQKPSSSGKNTSSPVDLTSSPAVARKMSPTTVGQSRATKVINATTTRSFKPATKRARSSSPVSSDEEDQSESEDDIHSNSPFPGYKRRLIVKLCIPSTKVTPAKPIEKVTREGSPNTVSTTLSRMRKDLLDIRGISSFAPMNDSMALALKQQIDALETNLGSDKLARYLLTEKKIGKMDIGEKAKEQFLKANFEGFKAEGDWRSVRID